MLGATPPPPGFNRVKLKMGKLRSRFHWRVFSGLLGQWVPFKMRGGQSGPYYTRWVERGTDGNPFCYSQFDRSFKLSVCESFMKCGIRSFIDSKINTPIGERCHSSCNVAKLQNEVSKKWIKIRHGLQSIQLTTNLIAVCGHKLTLVKHQYMFVWNKLFCTKKLHDLVTSNLGEVDDICWTL